MKNNFIICSYFTDEYEEESILLKKNIENLGYDFYIKKYKTRYLWELNVAIKPEFIRHCLDEFFGKSILYIDIDCKILKKLIFFENLKDFDISIFFTDRYSSEYWSDPVLTGTVYFENNIKVRNFVNTWYGIQKKNIFSWDQKTFVSAMSVCSGLTFSKMPMEYVKIFDIEKIGIECANPFIVHSMASRSLKKKRLPRKLPVDFYAKNMFLRFAYLMSRILSLIKIRIFT